jgi:hypothetical protein
MISACGIETAEVRYPTAVARPTAVLAFVECMIKGAMSCAPTVLI